MGIERLDLGKERARITTEFAEEPQRERRICWRGKIEDKAAHRDICGLRRRWRDLFQNKS
jgi:hypothetical protein